ncbi:MAG: ABC transporter ATP-binding protein [Olsenella sp.]
MSRGRGLLRQFRRYMTPEDAAMHKRGMAAYMAAGVFTGLALCTMMPAALSLQMGEPQWGLDFTAWTAILAVLAAFSCVLDYQGCKLGYTAGLGYMRMLQKHVGSKVASLPLGWFSASSAGRLSRIVTQEMMSSGQAVAYFVGQLVRNLCACVVFGLGTWVWSWQLGLMVTVAIPVLFALLKLGQKCIEQCYADEAPAEEALASRIVEFAQCQGALRACHAGFDYEELADSFAEAQRKSIRGLWWGVLGNLVSGTGQQMLVFAMILLGSSLCVSGMATPIEAIVIIGVALRFSTMISDVSAALFGLEERRQTLDGIDAVMDAPEMPVVQDPASLPHDAGVGADHVAFSYVPDKPVLRDIRFSVPPSGMLAIVGPSGCGKTTIIKLVARFYDTTAGAVRIGGIDVRDLTTEVLFHNVSFVFQDVYLFDDTLRNNVLLARPDASDGDLERVADLAGVTEIIKRLPKGWDTPCGEGGRALSGGERQRVSIARALLKQAPIVLFDEATSALDAENEANIVRSIEALRRTSTVIAVAHKLETIKMADQIIVLNAQGAIEEAGTHDELIARAGAYADFWGKRIQSAQWKLV